MLRLHVTFFQLASQYIKLNILIQVCQLMPRSSKREVKLSIPIFFNMILLYIFLISNIYGASTTVHEPSFLNVDKNASKNNLEQIGNREGRCKYDSFYFNCVLITIIRKSPGFYMYYILSFFYFSVFIIFHCAIQE